MTTAAAPGAGLLPVYNRPDILLTSGRGTRLITDQGREFLDFTSGIGVNALGYGHPAVTDAFTRASSTGLVHTSNLYRTSPGEELADFLVEHSFGSSVFFCNSGAEACEAALKFVRRAAPTPGQTAFVAIRGSFHGRTLGALSVTDRPAYQQPFEPLVPGVRFIEPDASPDAIAAAIDPMSVAGVIVEPIQGEGGVRPLSNQFLADLRARCDETGVPLIFDEIQCGLGRTGTLFAYEQVGVTPDILCLAKPMASGLPMGAVIVNDRIGAAIKPGDHATTFGGGPFVATVALATVQTISDPALLEAVRSNGELIATRLDQLSNEHATIKAVRGRGLMWGIELDGPATAVLKGAFERDLLLLTAGPNVIRLLPPLVISAEDLEMGLSVIAELLA